MTSHPLSVAPDTRWLSASWLLNDPKNEPCVATVIFHFSDKPTEIQPFQTGNTEGRYRQREFLLYRKLSDMSRFSE